MNQRQRSILSIIAAGAALGLLVGLTVADPPGPEALLPGVLFLFLIVFTHTFGVPLAGGRASLLPTATVAAFLVMGLTPAGWVAFLGALFHGGVRYHWAEELEQPRQRPLAALGVAALNAAFQTVSILAGGAVYHWWGGGTPYTGAGWREGASLVALAATYLALNLLLAGLYMAVQNRAVLRRYLRSLHKVLLFEAWPLIFAPFMALTYTRLGLLQFGLMGLGIVVISLTIRNLNLARQRLERRINELDSLQAVGQALSASLDLEEILTAIHVQTARLMPAENFYVALYDAETDEVSFPLAVDDGERVRWRSRRAGKGLTEHVLSTRSPLLIPQDVAAAIASLGLDRIGRPATSWLGVPLLAGDEALGVITVQSYSGPQVFDASHQEVLATIAAQAAVAIQNARLYARTDEALAHRLQEMDSILRTTRDGILLLDPEQRIVAANRALASFLGIAQLDLQGRMLLAPRPEEQRPLAALIGYTPEELQADFQRLVEGEAEFARGEITVPGPPERPVERTLTPVRNRAGEITGWLLVFRDLTEERALAQMREELTRMLIHDLRSPLSMVVTGLEFLEAEWAEGRTDAFERVISLGLRSVNYAMRLINTLLDLSRLESGQVTVRPLPVEVRPLLQEIAERVSPMAKQAQIEIEIVVEPDLPPLHADPEILDRTIHNLADNAVKFTPDGGHIRLWARPDAEQPGEALLIGVTDTGPGIPAEAQARLFKRYQQVISDAGRRVGTGLGLPFCKLAVEAHGGEIWVESEVGQGSTFVMRLPLVQENAHTAPEIAHGP